MSSDLHKTLTRMFQDANHVLVLSHVRPDGDAIGSMLGLGLALQSAGKSVQMVLSDGVPRNFTYLQGVEKIGRRPKGDFDLVVVVDCSDLQRIGEAIKGFTPDINIDHHITNLDFARVNLVLPNAVATSAILAEFLPAWNLPIDENIASALLTGLVSDTIGFRTSNMTAHALHLAADLMDHGANLPELYNQALVRRSFESALYWGQGLNHLQYENRLVWTSLSLEDRVKSNYPGNDDGDLVNVLSSIDSTDIAIIFVEQKGGRVKVSWRAQPGLDISPIALQFGGGGHAAASGAEIPGSLPDVQNDVLAATRRFLLNNSNNKGNNNHGKNPAGGLPAVQDHLTYGV